MSRNNPYCFLFAGGGTGGHLFPAVAVAQKIIEFKPESQIIFVGTKSKIEGRVIPMLGFKFHSIWIKGFARKFSFENLIFPLRVLVSVIQSIFISTKYKPTVAIGSGGYVSGPAIFGAAILGTKIILLEQNSYPGITTRLLEKKATEIHLSYQDSEKYFRDKAKLFVTGNPVRVNFKSIEKETSIKYFNLSIGKRTLLVLGGSLGAVSINEAVAIGLNKLLEKNIQVIWQTGKNYFEKYKYLANESVSIHQFIEDMNLAFSSCDLIISRAGATTIAEITTLGMPSILVPSPNVAENHQYYNAKSLSDKHACVMLEDAELNAKLVDMINELIFDDEKILNLKRKAQSFGKPQAAEIIAKRAIAYAERNIN
jgi:UDP-N-acetylglucosamine--N-acetylmuramyl-(pentapeptide) pyrophosphoryl-undecaprenol N-acetylglucosamine transferase